jgi:hypothetical protein
LLTDSYNVRGVHTAFAYGGLNRISSITYSDGTPAVDYTYDQSRTGFFSSGTLTRVGIYWLGDIETPEERQQPRISETDGKAMTGDYAIFIGNNEKRFFICIF